MKNKFFWNKLLTLFIVTSLGGWCVEVIGTLISDHTFENRGFLIGPFLPIYGFGALLFYLLFRNKKHSIFYYFVVGGVVATILEYGTAYLLETIFHQKWWDYSGYPYNLHGRIALWSSIGFAIGSVVVMGIVRPLISGLYKKIPVRVFYFINILFLIYFSVDLTLSIIRHLQS